MEGLWAAYRMTPNNVSVINATLLRLHLLDLRDSTEESMRYLLGSTVEFDPGHPLHASSETGEKPLLTLLVLDAQISPDSYTVSVRLQRPRVLVVVDFLLAVGQFFLPHMAMLPGGGAADEGKGHQLDPLGTQNDIRLKGGVFEQEEEELALSPGRQLVVDSPGEDDYVYDGKGGTLVLKDQEGNVLHAPPTTPLIIIGPSKRLRFCNVKIKVRGSYAVPVEWQGADMVYN
jgi:vacuolar protein sorting-associated protein 13A/C